MGNTVNVKPPGNSMIEPINTYLPKSMFESPKNMNKRLFLEIQKTNREYSKNYDDHIMSLFSKIDINTCNEDGENLLHIFTKYSRAKLTQEGTKKTYVYDYYLQHLFDIGCDINKRDNLGKVPMCYSNNINIDFFIKNKADLTIRDNKNHTILYHLSKGFYISYIEPFVKNYPDAIGYDEYIPEERLHKAIIFNDINKVKELLLCKPNFIDYQIKNQYQSHTPLSIAGEHGMVEIFYLLLEHGATIYPSLLCDLMDDYKINYNIQEGSDKYNSKEKIIEELIERRASINYQDSLGTSSLHNCITAKMVHLLLEGGADINARTKGYGERKVHNYFRINHYFCIDADPLMYMTVNMPIIDVFRTLFKYGANPNSKNECGHTAFMGIFVSTFLFGHYNTDETYHELIQLFLDNGADLYITDNDGYNVLDYLCVISTCINEKIRLSTIRYLYSKAQIKMCHHKTMEILQKAMSNE
jgi:ankyrin repeat protein